MELSFQNDVVKMGTLSLAFAMSFFFPIFGIKETLLSQFVSEDEGQAIHRSVKCSQHQEELQQAQPSSLSADVVLRRI